MLNPGFGAFELVVVAIVALLVVGPKDLPLLMRRVGQLTARMRAMAAEFRSSFDEMARQSELDELRKEVEAMRRGQLIDPDSKAEIEQTFQEIDQSLAEHHGGPYPGVEYAEAATLPPAEPEPEPPKPKRRVSKAKTDRPAAVAAAPRKPRAKKAGQA